jgi:Holliday junction resolvase RusA-like endonuclease
MTVLTVTVPGIPIGQGRVTSYGRGRTVHSNAATLKPWRQKIAAEVRKEMAATGVAMIPKPEPVALLATFMLVRPKSVPRKRWAPVVAPDLDHYVRALGDALSKVAVEDDAQIVTITTSKVYAEQAGVTFTLAPLVNPEVAA